MATDTQISEVNENPENKVKRDITQVSFLYNTLCNFLFCVLISAFYLMALRQMKEKEIYATKEVQSLDQLFYVHCVTRLLIGKTTSMSI